MSEIVTATDIPARWPDILAGLGAGGQEILVTDGQRVKAVIMDQARYRRLVVMATREERRQKALSLPTADSLEVWDAGFEALDRISEKFADLTDDEMEALFDAALTDIRGADQK